MESKFKDLFFYLNSYKRHRTLLNAERAKNQPLKSEVDFHELKMFQFIDSIELMVRGMQKEERENDNQKD